MRKKSLFDKARKVFREEQKKSLKRVTKEVMGLRLIDKSAKEKFWVLSTIDGRYYLNKSEGEKLRKKLSKQPKFFYFKKKYISSKNFYSLVRIESDVKN